MNEHNAVTRPEHYVGDIEFIDAAREALGEEDFKGFCRGQVIKYLWRAGKKQDCNAQEDHEKAAFYAAMLIGKDPRKGQWS